MLKELLENKLQLKLKKPILLVAGLLDVGQWNNRFFTLHIKLKSEVYHITEDERDGIMDKNNKGKKLN